jgi:predicted permease
VSELPEIFLDILGPVLILVAVGVGAGRWLGVPAAPLAKLSFWIIGPAFIFDSLANAGLATGVLGEMAAASALAFAASALFAAATCVGLPRDRRAAVVTTGAYGNVGNFGLAIVTFTFDERAQPFAAIVLVVVNGLGLILAVVLARGGWAGVAQALRSPMTLVLAPALLVNGFDVEIPTAVDRPIGLLAGAIIPVMLITLGIQLQQIGLPRIDLDVARSLVAKLLVQPLAAIPIVAVIGLSEMAEGAVILQAAMPAAVFTAVIAIELDARPDETATIVMAGTLASVLTLPWFILLVR